jgi:hypothetical protein
MCIYIAFLYYRVLCVTVQFFSNKINVCKFSGAGPSGRAV